eukprot:XP_001708909.1 Hypothetical protein GL50803_31983 [Giardia lamblia ATCC 50803]
MPSTTSLICGPLLGLLHRYYNRIHRWGLSLLYHQQLRKSCHTKMLEGALQICAGQRTCRVHSRKSVFTSKFCDCLTVLCVPRVGCL